VQQGSRLDTKVPPQALSPRPGPGHTTRRGRPRLWREAFPTAFAIVRPAPPHPQRIGAGAAFASAQLRARSIQRCQTLTVLSRSIHP